MRFVLFVGSLIPGGVSFVLASISMIGCAGTPETPPALPYVEPASEAELLEKARAEGRVIWYSAVDIKVAEEVAAAFERAYPHIRVQVERSGSERIFQRVSQEYASRIHQVDVIETSDASHFVVWKRQGLLARHVPPDVERHYAPEHRDPDGHYAVFRASLSPMAYNTRLLRAEEAPRSYADLLDPRWKGAIVKAHPGYSGTIMTATFALVRHLGWEYLEKLSRQEIMQVQSSTRPPKVLATGERAVMADGTEYNIHLEMERGSPVQMIYPEEGTPFISSPSAVMEAAPHPYAARLFQNFLYTRAAQQLVIDLGGLRSLHPLAREKPGRVPLDQIRLLPEDPVELERQVEEIKTRYAKYFGA